MFDNNKHKLDCLLEIEFMFNDDHFESNDNKCQ